MSFGASTSRRAVLGLLAAVRRLGTTLASVAEEQLSRAAECYRMELRRAASVIALSLAAALLAFASLVFLALTVLVAFWTTHPVAASASIAVVFAGLSFAAAMLLRGRTAG